MVREGKELSTPQQGMSAYVAAVLCVNALEQFYSGSCSNSGWSAEVLAVVRGVNVCGRILCLLSQSRYGREGLKY